MNDAPANPAARPFTPAETDFLGKIGAKPEDLPPIPGGEGDQGDAGGAGDGGADAAGGDKGAAAPIGGDQGAAQPGETAEQREARRQAAIRDFGLVPQQALHEARQGEKLTREELRSLQTQTRAIEEQLKALQPAAKDDDPEPDKKAQPLQWLDWGLRQVARELQVSRDERARSQRESEQTRAQQENITRLGGWAAERVSTYKATQPAYDEAYAFARDKRLAQYKALGWPDETARQQLVADEIQLAAQAFQRNAQDPGGPGTNPGELVYNYAVALGFVPKAAGGKQVKTDQGAGKKGEERDVATLRQIAEGQNNQGKLRGGNAGTAGEELTPEQVAAIDTTTAAGRERFDQAWRKLTGQRERPQRRARG